MILGGCSFVLLYWTTKMYDVPILPFSNALAAPERRRRDSTSQKGIIGVV
jgi:hypothetical protein